MAKKSHHMEETKKLMGVLVRMKPKPHEEMKGGEYAKEKKTRAIRKKPKSND